MLHRFPIESVVRNAVAEREFLAIAMVSHQKRARDTWTEHSS